MKTLVLANHKGGVGKSAIATVLAYYLAKQGLRVLAIDLDHQANLTRPLKLSGRATLASVAASQLMTQAQPSLPSQPFVLVAGDEGLRHLERQPAEHNAFASRLHRFVHSLDNQFDVCVIDTNPNPDIRLLAALVAADCVLSPIQLNQEAIDGIADLLAHDRYGIRKIKAVLNPKLQMIGVLPTLVEPTPFQRGNLVRLVERHHSLLISLKPGVVSGSTVAFIPKRSAIAEAQAEGAVLWEMKKTAARDTWAEIAPVFARLANILTGSEAQCGS